MKNIRKDYYKSLYEIAATINSAHERDDILQSIVENVTHAMGVKGCSLLLLKPVERLLTHFATYGLSNEYITKGVLSANESIPEVLMGKPVVVLNATEDRRIQYREDAKKEGIASILSAPVRLREEIIGEIRIYTNKQYNFNEDDIYFVSAVANLGAIALENTKRYDDLKEGYDTFRRLTF